MQGSDALLTASPAQLLVFAKTHRLARLQPRVLGDVASSASTTTFLPSILDGQTPAGANTPGAWERVVQKSGWGTRVSFCLSITPSPWEHPDK